MSGSLRLFAGAEGGRLCCMLVVFDREERRSLPVLRWVTPKS